MKLQDYKMLFFAMVGILALAAASPAISRLLVFPRTGFFTEFWILGPNHTAENYPFNITRNHNYTVFLGIGNQLGYSAYYRIEVKFRNQSQQTPNIFNRTASSLPSLYNIAAFAGDEGYWEMPVTFSLDYSWNTTILQFNHLTLNDAMINMTDNTITWDSIKNGFFGYLFFELWIYNGTTSDFQYHERFTSLRLNMTVS